MTSKTIFSAMAAVALATVAQPAAAGVITYSFASNPGSPLNTTTQVNSGNLPSNTNNTVSGNPSVNASGSFTIDTSLLGTGYSNAYPSYFGAVNFQSSPQSGPFLTGQLSIPDLGLPGLSVASGSSYGLIESFSAPGGPLGRIEMSSSVCTSTFWDPAETIQKTIACDSVSFSIAGATGAFVEDGFQLPDFIATNPVFSFSYFRSTFLYTYDQSGTWTDYVSGFAAANGDVLVSVSSNAVPEPMTLTLFAGGLGLIGAARRRRRAAAA